MVEQPNTYRAGCTGECGQGRRPERCKFPCPHHAANAAPTQRPARPEPMPRKLALRLLAIPLLLIGAWIVSRWFA